MSDSDFSDPLPSSLLTRLDELEPTVDDFATDKFAMRNELEELCNVRDAGAINSTVLICGRILNALVDDALQRLAATSLYTNLQMLQRFNLVSGSMLYWLNAIRRTSNDARHLHRNLSSYDAQWQLLFTERCLDWFFCQLPRAASLQSLTKDGEPLRLVDLESQRRALRAFDDGNFNSVEFAVTHILLDGTALHGSALLCATIEDLLNANALDTARQVLTLAEKTHSNDLRILQLRGLYWRRAGDLPRALNHMVPVFDRFDGDEETAGIMAAIWKETWLADESLKDDLWKSHRIYSDGWQRTHKRNSYLGINASTTALWLGRLDEAQATARQVQQTILESLQTLATLYPDKPLSPNDLGAWEQLTLAETYLVLGNSKRANQLYVNAFEQFAKEKAMIFAAIGQADKICDYLQIPLEERLTLTK